MSQSLTQFKIAEFDLSNLEILIFLCKRPVGWVWHIRCPRRLFLQEAIFCQVAESPWDLLSLPEKWKRIVTMKWIGLRKPTNRFFDAKMILWCQNEIFNQRTFIGTCENDSMLFKWRSTSSSRCPQTRQFMSLFVHRDDHLLVLATTFRVTTQPHTVWK